jgi:hypothetical protein
VSVSLGVEQLRALRVQLRSMARETYRRTLRDFGPCRDSSNSGLRDELLARNLAQGGPGCNHDGRVLVRKDRYEDDERKREGGGWLWWSEIIQFPRNRRRVTVLFG